MTKQTINVGTDPNDRSGDSLRTAFQKVNANFSELYTALGLAADANLNLGAFEFNGSTLTTTDSSSIIIDQATTVTSDLTVGGDILPSENLRSTLGSPTKQFHSIYVGTGSVYLGDARLSLESGKLTSSVGFNLTGSVGEVSGAVEWDNVLNKPTIPSVAGLASEDYVNTAISNIPAVDLTGYALTADIPDVSSFITADDLPAPVDLTGLATEQYVDDAVGAVVVPDVSNFITAQDIPAIPADISDLTDTEGLLGSADTGNWSFNSNILSEGGAGDAVIEASDYAGAKLILQTRGLSNKQWAFDQDGGLTLPEGGDILDSEGNSVLGQGGSSTTELAYLELTNKAFGEPVEFNNTGEDGGVDEISEGLHITRGNVGWLYNPLEESESGENTPTNSLWNNDGWDDLTDIETRTYTTLESIWGGNFRNIVGAKMILLDTTTDKYYAVEFVRWSRDGEGFSYVRYEIDLTQLQEGITFADGTVQKTAYVPTTVKSTAEGDRRIEEVSGYKSVSVTSRSTSDYTGASSRTTSTSYEIFVKRTTELDAVIPALYNGDSDYSVEISFDNVNFFPTNIVSVQETEYWFADFSYSEYVPQTEDDPVYIRITSGAEPVTWWNKSELPGGGNRFRGAIIDYHAYIPGRGTIVGTIHIVDDDGEDNITHTEVSSGSSSLEYSDLWYVTSEGEIQYRQLDGDDRALKIQWTAKVFYGSEYYDD